MKTPTLMRGKGFKISVSAESDFKNNLQPPSERTKYKLCGCDGKPESSRCQLVSLQNGIDDAEHLRADLTIDQLTKRFRNRQRYGYCSKCAWNYVHGILLKFEQLKEKGG